MSAPNATDTTNPPYNSLARYTRSSYTIIDGVSVPLQGAPLLPGQTSPVNYMLAQRALAETVDITHDTPGHAYMHARTAAILLRTFTPPAIGTALPIYPELPLIRCAAFSSATDMQCYALDVNSTDGLVYSHFWQLSGAVWDSVSVANQDSLRALRTCLFSWSTEPTKPLPIPDILHDILLKTGNPRGCPHGGTVALLCRNLTDGSGSTSRYPDPHTTTILAQCTYILNRLARHIDHQLPNFRVTYAHMTTPLLID